MNEETAGWRQDRKSWLGKDLTKEQLCMDFTPAHLSAIAELMRAIKRSGMKFQQLERQHFSHPDLDGFFAEVLREIKAGSGAVILRGFPVASYSVEDMELIYYGMGTHFGRGCSQSTAGDLMGHVADRGNSRGYTNTRKLGMHVDSAENVGLLCVRKAREGGENVIASALKIREIILQERPDFLAVLERGFRVHRRGEEQVGHEPISPYRVPIFSSEAGLISGRYVPDRIQLAVRAGAYTLTKLEVDALEFFDSVCFRDDVRFDLQLEPGEALFLSNFEMLHSRTAFVDWTVPAEKRLVLRLWLEGQPPRPLKKEIFTYQNPSGRQGIDALEGRAPGAMDYLPTDANLREVAQLSDG